MPLTISAETTEAVYNFIRTYIEQRGFSPSLREIAAGCFLGHSTIIRYLDRLEAMGYITRELGVARSIRLTRLRPKFRKSKKSSL